VPHPQQILAVKTKILLLFTTPFFMSSFQCWIRVVLYFLVRDYISIRPAMRTQASLSSERGGLAG